MCGYLDENVIKHRHYSSMYQDYLMGVERKDDKKINNKIKKR